MDTPESAQQQIQMAAHGAIIKNPISTKIPGWKRHQDKAYGLLTNWAKIVGLPESYGIAIYDWFDKAPEKYAFHEANVQFAGDAVRVICSVETSPKRFEERTRVFPLSELEAITGVKR